MSGHAKLSPSSAERWMDCAGSVVLSDGMPQRTSAFADEGTEAHEIAEFILLGKAYTCSAEMLANVRVYTDYVMSLCAEKTALWFIEQRVAVNAHVYGTADAIIWHEAERHLRVIDLKYGAGVAVEVKNNKQLMIYALAALLTMNYNADLVTVTIVQPRCAHPDGPIRSISFTVLELMDLFADIEDAIIRVEEAKKANDIVPFLSASEKGCRWCLAAPKCPLLIETAQKQAKKVFTPGLPYNPISLSETLDTLPLLEAWIKNVREFAYAEAEKGNDIPDYKLVEKRATRKWRSDENAAERLKALGLDPFDYKLITPAAAEKLLAKEERALLDELTVKESSGHALVHETDKRPAVRVDAASAFAGK